MKNYKGFTLIEILVVISIIAFLAAFTVVQFSNTQAKKRDLQRANDLSVIEKTLEMYKSQYGVYPIILGFDPSTNKVGYCSNCINGSCDSTAHPTDYIPYLVNKKFIDKLPLDPNASSDTNIACGFGVKNYVYISNGIDYKLILRFPENDLMNPIYSRFKHPELHGAAWEIYSPGAYDWL